MFEHHKKRRHPVTVDCYRIETAVPRDEKA
jgi:hypothetical protein